MNKRQFRIINTGKGVLNITDEELHEVQSETTINSDSSSTSYLKYVALISQFGTNAPVATVLENTLGVDLTWTRDGSGDYTLTPDSALTLDLNKVVIFTTKGLGIIGWTRSFVSTNVIKLQSYNDEGSATDGLSRTSIEIRVYP